MDKERETANKLREALRTRIELLAKDLSRYNVEADHKPGKPNPDDYLLASSYLIHDSSEKIFDSSERLNALTRRLSWLTIFLAGLTVISIIVSALTLLCR